MQKPKILRINTYKSIWEQDLTTGNYRRIQKPKYFYEPVINFLRPVISKIPYVKRLCSLLGKMRQGVDAYKHYTNTIDNNLRGRWGEVFPEIRQRFESVGISFEGKSVLDVSGEPGFFAADAKEVAKYVLVTGFATEVVDKMKEKLGVDSVRFDYQADDLRVVCPVKSFDLIFVRYSIGFCENLPAFLARCHEFLNEKGSIYISFSPASRGVCARWMYDDYVYLRQYTRKFLVDEAASCGLQFVKEWDDGSERWNHKLHPAEVLFAMPYLRGLFKGMPKSEKNQDNIAMLFVKK